MRSWLIAAGFAALVLSSCKGNDSPVGPDSRPSFSAAAAQAPTGYIVVYNPSVGDTRAEIAQHVNAQAVQIRHIYNSALHGWAGDINSAELLRLSREPHVAFIEKDAVVSIVATQAPTPSWGLDRIDQRNLPLSSSFSYNTTGAGVHFYGIDTGILYSHSDFGGRASAGYDAVTSGGNAVDCNGHGTHTASTAAGSSYGVAKGMTIIGVRVLDCSGSGLTSGVIAGVDWVTQNAIKPAVANMSLGGSASSALDQAVANSIGSGVVYAIAAGNSGADACLASPARVSSALTVAATDASDARASWSNYGTCVDLFAPGVGITAAWIGSNTATNTISGTSMATPHVAGAAGLYLQANPGASPAQVAGALTGNATAGIVGSAGSGSPNELLYVGFIGGAVNQSPTATITAPAAGSSFVQGTSVSFAGTGSDPEDGTLSGSSLVWTSSLDGQIGTGTAFTKSNLSVGTHSITLKATDSKGATGTSSRSISITAPPSSNQPPVASFSYNCVGLPSPYACDFNPSGSTDDVGIVRYDWKWWGGSQTTTSPTIIRFTFPAAGSYHVMLTVTDGGGLTAALVIQVTVPVANQAPTASISLPAAGSSFVQGTSVSFSGSGSDPEDGTLTGSSLVWSSSLDGQIGTGTSFSKSNLSVGSHTITLTATDSKGATGSASRSITITAPVNQPPTATISSPAAASSYVQGTSVSFTGSGSDPEDGNLSGASLVWTSSLDGQIGTGTSFSKSNLSVGTHTITLTATDSKGATGSASRSITVTALVNQPPVASFTYNCVGLSTPHSCDFSPTGSTDDVGIVSYAWKWWGGSQTTTSPTTIRFTFPASGAYHVTLTVTDGGGLSSSMVKEVTVP